MSNENQFCLHVSHIKKSFKPDFYKPATQVLKDVSFEVRQGVFTGLIGPNGAGKTTTIKCLLEFIYPDSGSIKYFKNENVLQAKSKIGFLPERPYFQDFLTGVEFLKFHWQLVGDHPFKKTVSFKERSEQVLEWVKLAHAKDKKLQSYSKGMLQRIGIAQALLVNPDFLILDEPMSGLDPDGRILVKDILKDLKKQNISVLMSSHLLEDIHELCDDLIVIYKGKSEYCGSLNDFKKQHETLEEAYRRFKGQFEENLNV